MIYIVNKIVYRYSKEQVRYTLKKMKLLFAEMSSLFLELLSEVWKNGNETCMPTKYSIIRMYMYPLL